MTPLIRSSATIAGRSVSRNRRSLHASHEGAALIIVLGFVILLLGLLMAYFSRSTLQRQISSASSDSAMEEIFAQGAIDTTISDLRQEIVAGSTSNGTGTNIIYTPVTNAAAVPAISGFTTNTGLENLVKISSSSNFATFSGYTGGTLPANRATASSTTAASYNGRAISLARWNKPLLITQKNASTDTTPTANFTAPNWILVARNGANPTGTTVTTNMAWSATNATTVIGRYAYAIYNEGGLLDANVAGYPLALSNTTAMNFSPSYKGGTYFADLTQLGLTTTQITALIGWRNYATALSSGIYPSYTVGTTGLTNYAASVLANSNSFLSVATNTTVSGSQTLTDRQFSSRQQLIDFLKNSDTGNIPAAMTALQSLGTFSRALEQPSLAPPTGRPTIATGTGGNASYGNDDVINPRFLTNRVTTAFTRNNGTQAVVGEPLVKTRFALNRLAWITYKGPIATSSGTLNTDSSIQNIIAELERRGLTAEFLKQGTADNIIKYFGLRWDSSAHVWCYDVHNGTTDNTNSGSCTGAITRLAPSSGYASVSGKNREADFVELLKATVNVGSLGKGAYTNSTGGSDFPANYQYGQDISTDYAIIQMAANIIDQADLDGFPTRITFNNGNGTKEFDGVENLPYLYRFRMAAVQPRSASVSDTTITDPGTAVVLSVPEIWNPHDQDGSYCASNSSTGSSLTDGSGNPLFPTHFRVVADTTDPVSVTNSSSRNYMYAQGAAWNSRAGWGGTVPSNSVPFNGDISDKKTTWSADYTAIEFNIPTTTNGLGLFREPTLLWQLDIPANSSLRLGDSNYLKNPTLLNTLGLDGGRLSRLESAGLDTNGTLLHVPNGERFFGMYVSTVPITWNYTNASGTQLDSLVYFNLEAAASQTGRYATVRMQIPDPYVGSSGSWISYDTKYLIAVDNLVVSVNSSTYALNAMAGLGDSSYPVSGHFSGLGSWLSSAWDPRTARFGSPVLYKYQWGGVVSDQPPITQNTPNYGALSSSYNTLISDRPDVSSGFGNAQQADDTGVAGQGLPNVNGWSPSGTSFWHLGMISQNSSSFSGNGLRWSADPNGVVSSGAQYYSDPDGVIRRAMGGYATTVTGLPMATATSYSGSTPAATSQSESRPTVLNRPFLSVAELGHVFSGTPWKNLNFFTPESGDAGLLDVFCISEPPANALVAGKVDLNTRQEPVLQAIIAGSYKDTLSPSTTTSTNTAATLASALIARTTGTATGPLMNISELVGKWTSGTNYDGFSTDLSTALTDATDQAIQRFREAPMRALAASGQTRVWNLMIDVVVQTGRYPQSATSPDQFLVEGEQRYWVHVAIDRLTGQVLDKQIEVVRE